MVCGRRALLGHGIDCGGEVVRGFEALDAVEDLRRDPEVGTRIGDACEQRPVQPGIGEIEGKPGPHHHALGVAQIRARQNCRFSRDPGPWCLRLAGEERALAAPDAVAGPKRAVAQQPAEREALGKPGEPALPDGLHGWLSPQGCAARRSAMAQIAAICGASLPR